MATSLPSLLQHIFASNVGRTNPSNETAIKEGFERGLLIAEDLNAPINLLSQYTLHALERGIAEWDTNFNYQPLGLTRGSDNNIYINVFGAEQAGVDPVTDSDESHWKEYTRYLTFAMFGANVIYTGTIDFASSSPNHDLPAGFTAGTASSSTSVRLVGLGNIPTMNNWDTKIRVFASLREKNGGTVSGVALEEVDFASSTSINFSVRSRIRAGDSVSGGTIDEPNNVNDDILVDFMILDAN